ncbi:MAG: ATP-binding protein [Myxococcota bacterium]
MSTTTQLAHNALDEIASREILEGFARLHQLVAVADRRGRILWMSDALGVLCGGAHRLTGRNLNEVLPLMPRPDQIASIRSQLRGRESFTKTRLELRTSSRRPLEVDVSAFRVESDHPDAPLVVAVVSPVAADESARSDVTAKAGLLAALLDASPDALIAFDRGGLITFVNPALEDLLGRSASELLNQSVSFILPDESLSLSGDAEPETAEREIELLPSDGGRRWVSLSTRALRGADGRVSGGVVRLRDVSESRRRRDRLERENRELESYVHNVSHDLRSPLVSLLGFTRLLRQDYESLLDDTGRHFLDRIEQAGQTMEALIQDLLELSRIGESTGPVQLVDSRALLLQLHAELKPRLDEQAVSLRLPEAAPLIRCDQTRLYQLFSNLVGNALLHMGPCENPQVAVEVREEPGFHHITVADNGRGIPADQHERIFEVFQTVGPHPDGGRSTGIGLAIVKKVADTQDGRVWVESEPGKGSTFHVLLPR